jgi:hypothetical protein
LALSGEGGFELRGMVMPLTFLLGTREEEELALLAKEY